MEKGKVKGEWEGIKIKAGEELSVKTVLPKLATQISTEVFPEEGEKKYYFEFYKTNRTIRYLYIYLTDYPIYIKFIPPKEEDVTENLVPFFVLLPGIYFWDIETVGFVTKPFETATGAAKLSITAFY